MRLQQVRGKGSGGNPVDHFVEIPSRRTITCVCTTLNSRSPLQRSSSQGCYIKSKRVDSVVGKPIITIISVVELRGSTVVAVRRSRFSPPLPSTLSFLSRMMFITRRRRDLLCLKNLDATSGRFVVI